MKKITLLALVFVTVWACKNDPKQEKVEEVKIDNAPKDGGKGAEIIKRVIDSAGGHRYETATIEFKFREATYKSVRNCGMFELSRSRIDSTGTPTESIIGNTGFIYKENGEQTTLPDSMATNYENSVNSVHYFVQLPFGLDDRAVRKELIAEDSIQGKPYYEIQVNFKKQDDGEDYQDTYVYWVNKNTYKVDYLAYSYEVNGGGMRFREAINPRKVEGIRFVDYKNYNPKKESSPKLNELDELFEKGELELYSTIENKDIKVEVLDRNCA